MYRSGFIQCCGEDRKTQALERYRFFEIALSGVIGYVEWCKQIPYVPKATYGKDLDAHKGILERAAEWLSNNASWLDPERAEDDLAYLYDSLGPPPSLPRHQNEKKSSG